MPKLTKRAIHYVRTDVRITLIIEKLRFLKSVNKHVTGVDYNLKFEILFTPIRCTTPPSKKNPVHVTNISYLGKLQQLLLT